MSLSPALALILLPAALNAQTPITAANWGSVTTPVFGTTQGNTYAGAELFAGPNQFGFYYAGVLPNGRKVVPAAFSTIQVGMNPVASVLTADTRFLVVANSSERQPAYTSYLNPTNTGGYSLTVISNASLSVASELSTAGSFYTSLVATGFGPYTIYASGGADGDVKVFTLSLSGILTPATPASIPISPLLPPSAGYASSYLPAASAALFAVHGYLPSGAAATFPAGMQLSPDGRFLYVACNLDNSIAAIDVFQNKVVQQVPAGYFPYGVAIGYDGQRIYSTNRGVTAYRFAHPSFDSNSGSLLSLLPNAGNAPAYFIPKTASASSSSVSLFLAPNGNGTNLTAAGSIPGAGLDDLSQVGGEHPSAVTTVRNAVTGIEMLFYTKSNSDSLGMVRLDKFSVLPDFDLSPVPLTLADGHKVHGAYPTALVASPDATTLYVAESGMNSVAVLDISRPLTPVLIARIPTGWYPTSLALTSDGQFLFVTNAKGIGEDRNPLAPNQAIASDPATDSNSMFGMVQILQVGSVAAISAAYDKTTVLTNNYAVNPPADTSVVPVGGQGSSQIKHVFIIVQENKTFDSILGALPSRFGAYASQYFQKANGNAYFNSQFSAVTPNTQALAAHFATAVNYYSDAEESNAGAQFLASGTATDFTEKTVLAAGGRGLLTNRNVEPEDYPGAGYIFNNAARNGVTFKDYGFLINLAGSDNGANSSTRADDPTSGLLGLPQLQADNVTLTSPLVNAGDVTSPLSGLGQLYYLDGPALAVLGERNPNGESRIDLNYPGLNFNISDQRRALEFIQDFDRMAAANTVPQLIYIYLSNGAGGAAQAANAASVSSNAALQQAADTDTALGMVVSHLMNSRLYYDPQSNTGSAIFVTYSSSQGASDHIHPHRNLLIAVSPFAKQSYLATRHYSTASVVKTAELLLGLPPNNLGDLFATDLRDMFQSTNNGISIDSLPITKPAYSRRTSDTIGRYTRALNYEAPLSRRTR